MPRGFPVFLRSLTFRLSLFYVSLFLVSVIFLVVFVYLQTLRAIDRQTEQEMRSDAAGLSQQYTQQGLAGLIEAVEDRIDQPERAGNGLYLLIDEEGAPLAGNVREWPTAEPNAQGLIDFTVMRDDGTHQASGQSYVFNDGSKLLVGRDLRARQEFRQVMIEAATSSLAIALVLGIGGGLLISRRMLGRLDTINRSAERIMGGDLGHRIETSGARDEFDRLSDTLNAMLEEIRRLMAGMRTVTDNIAHDLRSPLTRMRNRLESLAAIESHGADERQAIEKTISDADQLLATFNALLSIANAESGSARADMAPLDLGALALDVAELYEPAAAERGIAVTCRQEAVSVTGSRQLLFQAVSNLVDNAVKHTPSGGAIVVSVTAQGGGARLSIADSGSGIAVADREKVLAPFVRLDASRSTPGSGLGLALVAAIARLHGACLTLEDNAPGLAISLVFPTAHVTTDV